MICGPEDNDSSDNDSSDNDSADVDYDYDAYDDYADSYGGEDYD